MNIFRKTLALALVCAVGFCVVGCHQASDNTGDSSGEKVTLRMAAGYQYAYEAISFKDAEYLKDGSLTLADGVTYHLNDLKPTWKYISEYLDVNFEDKFTGAGSAQNEFNKWDTDGLDQVDIICGSASVLVEAGSQGKLIDLNQYLDEMPNFKAYLESNAIARLSITGDTTTGAIYFSPYFDGVDDIERMPLMRADLVRALLDGDTPYAGENRAVNTSAYTPYMPTSGTVKVTSLTADGSSTQTITKDYDAAGNIIEVMNNTPGLTGDQAVALFRQYIDEAYGDTYDNRSDLFLGYDACWDADELVALLRCAVASLNDDDGNPVSGLYSRETSNLQREIDIVRFAGTLFGVRGLESRQDYLYFDSEGQLHDARQEEDAYEAVLRMNALTQEGLINVTGSGKSENYLAKDAGIVSYDYNQTQTIYNNTKLNQDGDTGEEYIAVMVPVAKWDDGDKTTDEYMRFTESWRSVKTDGWAISKAGIGDDKAKLKKALALIDFAFSVQGQITMSYGPDSFIQVKDASVEVKTWADVEKKYYTFDFNGQQMPLVSTASYESLQKLTGGNYTNYARRYLGSTLNGFPKSQAFEYQCTNEIGKKGAAVLSAAISKGVIKHPVLAINTTNMWYTSVPTTLPTTSNQTTAIKGLTDLSTDFASSKGKINVFFNIVKTGTPDVSGFTKDTALNMANYVKTALGGSNYLTIRQAQWEVLQTYYNKITK